MIDPSNVPDVDPTELLARFILYSKHVRRSDATIKADAFVPHPYDELSVTRHRDATEEEICNVGRAVAAFQKKNLHGRGDVEASAFVEQGLEVVADPFFGRKDLPDNPNHANVTGWPADDRDRQRLLALEIAAKAKLIRPPDG